MDWSCPYLGDAIGSFKQKMTLYVEDENIVTATAQARKICRGIGDEGLRRLNASGLTDDEKKNPVQLWDFFNKQLKVSVNFRIHRLHLMRLRQKTDETLDDFVTRARTLALKCQFTDVELNERMLELIIASTPYDSFRKDLLGKPIGYTTAETLQEGRKYEAITAGNAQLQQMARVTEEVHSMRTHDRKCNNCGTNHKPRQCPAYRDACNSCGAIGHWEKCCRKKRQNQQTRKPSDSGTQRRSHSSKRNKYGKHNKGNEAAHSLEVETGYETGGESYPQEFYAVNLSSKSLDSIGQEKKSRDEAYTRLKIRPPGIRTKNCSLLLKIDTGASGNTLPKRTFQQMYGTHSYHLLEPANNVILTAYNGATIECLGKLDMLCRYKDEKWTKATFYVVDVPGPAVVGLPTSKQLHLVTINVDSVADTRGTKSTPQPVIHDVNDM